MADTLIREVTAYSSQPLSPVPQYWNGASYSKVEGVNGASRVILYNSAGQTFTNAIPGITGLVSTGTQANAWSANATISAGATSNTFDANNNATISAFGVATVTATTTILFQVSQDNSTWYNASAVSTISVSAGTSVDFYLSIQAGNRYVRLITSGVSATITATIAGK